MTSSVTSASPALLGSRSPLSQAYDVALLDLDGVCFAGQARIEHAAQSVNAARGAGMRLSFVTNNASRAPRAVVDKLAANDIEAYPNEVFSAAMDAAALLGEHVEPGSPVLVIGGEGLRQALVDEGYRLVDSAEEGPLAVVQGWAPEVDWAMMSEGVYAIGDGALHVATNTDATLPTERGLALGNGSLVVAVANASGKDYLAGGKPFPGIYRRALARAGGTTPLAVGDRLDTDLVGARAAGIAGMHVLTGVSTARDVVLAPAQQRPSYLHTDLRGLNEPHPAPSRGEQGWWQVGDWAAQVAGGVARLRSEQGTWDLDAQGTTAQLALDAYRALACAVWEQLDHRGPAGAPALPELSVLAPSEG